MIKSKRRNMRIALGVDMATVLEVTNTHILGMFDMNMIDAWNSLQERSS